MKIVNTLASIFVLDLLGPFFSQIAQFFFFCQQDPVVSKALGCLEASWETIEQGRNGSFVYTKTLMAYAFALAGNQEKRNEILKSLDKEAIREGKNVCSQVCLHPAPMKENRGAHGEWIQHYILVPALWHTEVPPWTSPLPNDFSFSTKAFCLASAHSVTKTNKYNITVECTQVLLSY